MLRMGSYAKSNYYQYEDPNSLYIIAIAAIVTTHMLSLTKGQEGDDHNTSGILTKTRTGF